MPKVLVLKVRGRHVERQFLAFFWAKFWPEKITSRNGSVLTPKPSFPDFGDFDPCRGQQIRKTGFLESRCEVYVFRVPSIALRILGTRRPPAGVFGPFGPEVPLRVSESVSPNIGVCPKVSGEVPLGPF